MVKLTPSPKMQADAPEMPVQKLRLVTLNHLDGRTRAARRAREIAAELANELRIDLSPIQTRQVERAAALLAVAEDTRARKLAGDAAIRVNDLVRIDNCADRALRRIRDLKSATETGPADLQKYFGATVSV